MADGAALQRYLSLVGCDAVTAAHLAATAVATPNASSAKVLCDQVVSSPESSPLGVETIQVPESTLPIWEVLQQQVAECTACDLAKGRRKTVFFSGNADADLLLIGEAPDGEEDEQGVPFVGRAGALLTRMLAAIGLDRDQVAIVHVVKCHPPNSRDPRPQEIAACRHFLDAQIARVQPKVIGLLGKGAACAMLGQDAPLSVLRHRWHTIGEIPAYVTHHPAFLLRSSQQKGHAWQDLLQFKARLLARRDASVSGGVAAV
ncbi:MAG: uracil-DNA glycosylase [Mariprofundales bacterium]